MLWANLLDACTEQGANRSLIANEADSAEKPSAAREQVHNTLRFARRAMTAEEMADACAIGLRHARAHLDSLVADGLAGCSGEMYSLVAKVRPRRG